MDTDASEFSKNFWGNPVGNQQNFPLTGIQGMKQIYAGIPALSGLIDYHEYSFHHKIINFMVEKTNLYAMNSLVKEDDVPPNSKLHEQVQLTSKKV